MSTKYMTMHRFIRMNKSAIKACEPLFKEVIATDLDVEPFVLVGNYMAGSVQIEAIRDYKVNCGSDWWKTSKEITDCFSIRSLRYGPLLTLLTGLYSKKCKYER